MLKRRKGEIATLLTLGLVIVGTVVTLASSFFISKKPQTTSTKAAATYCCVTRSGADVYYNTGTCSSITHPCCGNGAKKPPCSGGVNPTAGGGGTSTPKCTKCLDGKCVAWDPKAAKPSDSVCGGGGTSTPKCIKCLNGKCVAWDPKAAKPSDSVCECKKCNNGTCIVWDPTAPFPGNDQCKAPIPTLVNPTQGVSATCPGSYGTVYKYDASTGKCLLLKGKSCAPPIQNQCCDLEVPSSNCDTGGIPRCSSGTYTNQTGCENICGVGQCRECMASSTTHKYECINTATAPACSKPRTYSSQSNCINEGCQNCTQCTFSGAIRYECEGSGSIQCPAGESSCGQICCIQGQCGANGTCVSPSSTPKCIKCLNGKCIAWDPKAAKPSDSICECKKCNNGTCIVWDPTAPFPGNDQCKTPTTTLPSKIPTTIKCIKCLNGKCVAWDPKAAKPSDSICECKKCNNGTCIVWDPTAPFPGNDQCKAPTTTLPSKIPTPTNSTNNNSCETRFQTVNTYCGAAGCSKTDNVGGKAVPYVSSGYICGTDILGTHLVCCVRGDVNQNPSAAPTNRLLPTAIPNTNDAGDDKKCKDAFNTEYAYCTMLLVGCGLRDAVIDGKAYSYKKTDYVCNLNSIVRDYYCCVAEPFVNNNIKVISDTTSAEIPITTSGGEQGSLINLPGGTAFISF